MTYLLSTSQLGTTLEPMRIGLSTSMIQRGQTGIAQYVFALLRAMLAAADHEQFALFVLEEDIPLFEFAKNKSQIVPVPERFRSPLKNILWHQTVLPRLARKLQIDVLHVPSYRRLLWSRPCPLVATIHDLAPFHVRRKYDLARTFYGRVIARRLAQRQDRIIAVSGNTAQDVERFFGIPRQRIQVVYNGVEHERFFPGASEEARAGIAHRFGLEEPFFLYVARLEHPAKNHVRLISAFNDFKAASGSRWQLVFGGSDWHGAETIRAAVAQSPFSRDIRLLGFVANKELPDLYRTAGIFVYPSLYEGFGMPPIEAMACGCPVICSARGSLREIVGSSAALVDPENVNSITGQLEILATDTKLRQHLREAGLEQAKRFTWQRSAVETLSAYARVGRSAEDFPTLKPAKIF